MSITRIRWLAAGAALLVLALGYLSLTRTVTILADGRAYDLATRAITVGGALKDAGLALGPKDKVEPSSLSLIGDGLVIAVQRASRIQLTADGRTYETVSGERNPTVILALFGLSLNPGDRLELAGRQVLLDEDLLGDSLLSLELRRATQISLTDGGQTTEILSSAPTLGEALAEHGIQLTAADRLDPAPETPLDAPITATLVRAAPIQIQIGEQTLELSTAAVTVGEALAEAGIALQGLDFSEPAEDEALPADRTIRVVRVSEALVLEQHTVPHDTDFQEDPEAELDTVSVVQEGQDGVSASRVRVRYENGTEVSRVAEGERVLVEARTAINGYGSKIVIHTITVAGATIEYYRAVTVFTTYYTPCRSGSDTCLYGTSSGLPLDKGVIATYLTWYRALKFATVYVPGYGPGTIGDVGAWPDRSVPWIDLAFSDAEAEANDPPWSNQYLVIYFTTPVPAYVPLIWPPG